MDIVERQLHQERELERLKRLRKLRAYIKLVMANLVWLGYSEGKLSGNVHRNIHMLIKGKVKISDLTVQEKAILCKETEDRTEEEMILLGKVIGDLKCFQKFPDNVKAQLAAVTYFRYFPSDRTILKQDRPPNAMYFILSGEVVVMQTRYDEILEEWIEEDIGVLTAGTMFGEVALLHGVQRLATIVTITDCELLILKKEDFNLILKDTVKQYWDEVSNALDKLGCFNDLDPTTRRECAIISRIKTFTTGEILLGDKVGQPKWVYFVVEGLCHLIECLELEVHHDKGVKKYKLLIETKLEQKQDGIAQGNDKENPSSNKNQTNSEDKKLQSTSEGCQKDLSPDATNPDLIKENRKATLNVKYEKHFIKVANLGPGACFNIGERFQKRRIIAKTPTTVLLMPRYWMDKISKNNIRSRIRAFLDGRLPNTRQVFKNFLDARKFKQYRQALVKDLLAEKRVYNNNNIHNVPYSIRLEEGADDYY